MSLRLKVFLVLGAVMAALFFCTNIALSRFLISEFVALEREEMEEDISRITDGLRSRMDDLSVKLADWAQWDDTYRYVSDRNEEYVVSNINDESLDILRLNIILIADGSGSVVFKKSIRNGQEEPFSEEFERHLLDEIPRLFESGLERREEIVNVPEGMIVYAARPITSSDGMAEPNGYMVFGYFFTQELADSLGRTSHLSVRYESFMRQQPLPDDFAEANGQLSFEHPVVVPDAGDDHVVRGYALVEGGHGKPIAIFRVDTARDIYHKGQESLALFSKLISALSVVFAVAIFFVLDWLVLRKIARLGSQVRKIRESGDLSASVALPGKDEFASLAHEVDGMLVAMRETEAKRQQQINEMEKLNRLMVNRELRMIELKQEIRGLKK